MMEGGALSPEGCSPISRQGHLQALRHCSCFEQLGKCRRWEELCFLADLSWDSSVCLVADLWCETD